MQITRMMRYPVKGLEGQLIDTADFARGGAIPGDRMFAVRHADTNFDPENPIHMSKVKFLALMTHAALAGLRAAYDGTFLTLRRNNEGSKGDVFFEGNLNDPADAARLEQGMADYIGLPPEKTPRLVSADGHMFSDVPEKCLSIVNNASVAALAQEAGVPLDPLRFRANIYLDGMQAWAERDWAIGDCFRVGTTRLKVMKHITRCNAVNVNLETAQIDQNLPKMLMQKFGANVMGVYCTVEEGGTVKVGDSFLA